LVSIHSFLAKAGFHCASTALQQECIDKKIGSLSVKVFPDSELDPILSSYLKLHHDKENHEYKQSSISNGHIQRSPIIQVNSDLLYMVVSYLDCLTGFVLEWPASSGQQSTTAFLRSSRWRITMLCCKGPIHGPSVLSGCEPLQRRTRRGTTRWAAIAPAPAGGELRPTRPRAPRRRGRCGRARRHPAARPAAAVLPGHRRPVIHLQFVPVSAAAAAAAPPSAAAARLFSACADGLLRLWSVTAAAGGGGGSSTR
jgi:hypothetical protein